jgi:hypothetical protein
LSLHFLIWLALVSSGSVAAGMEVLQRRVFGRYEARVERDEESGGQRILVTMDGKVVHREDELGSHFWIGNHFDESLKGRDPYSGKDLTGNGIPDIVLTSWSGGAHCCNSLTILEMTESGARKVITVDGGSYGFIFKDLDSDGRQEIEFWDWPIDYLFNSFAHSAQGRVVLKSVGDGYRVAKSLMYRKRADEPTLAAAKVTIQKVFSTKQPGVPYELLKLMMDLSYSGYRELALKMADDTWPRDLSGLAKFKLDFNRALAASPYWTEFYAPWALNNPTLILAR